jgi:microcystin-dependent protein
MARLKSPTTIGDATLAPENPDIGDALVFDGSAYVPQPVDVASGVAHTPIGALVMWPVATPPAGWLICDGSGFDGGTYPGLAAVLGGTTLPDLRGKFPIGVGTLGSDSYALGDVGGEARHALTAAENALHGHNMPHTHDVNPPNVESTGDSVTHTHTMTDHTHTMAHTHAIAGSFISDVAATGSAARFRSTGSFATEGSSAANTGNPTNPQTGGRSAGHTHDVNIPQFESLGSNTAATANQGSGSAHENRPPYLALNFIIKAAA